MATIGMEHKDIGSHHGNFVLTGTRQQPISSQATVRRGHHVRNAISALFANTGGDTFGAKFDTFVDELLPDCSIEETANFVRVAGKKSRDNTDLHVLRRLPDIASKLDSLASYLWNFTEISFIIYGLQSCKESNSGHSRIMLTMSKIATRTLLANEAVNAESLSMILYGLRSNEFNFSKSKVMLSCLHRIVDKCRDQLDAQAVGDALYGMRGMSSDNEDVRSLLRALTPLVQGCTEQLSAQGTGNALHGLQGMSSDHKEVLSLLCALTPKLQRHGMQLSANDIRNALSGLRSMGSDSEEVRSLLCALTDRKSVV